MSETQKTETQSLPAEKKGVKILKTVVNTVINIMIVLVLIVSLLIAVMALTSKANGISTIFGYSFHTIQTPSMEGGDPQYEGGDYKVGDLVIGKVEISNDHNYALGDIVSYQSENEERQLRLICHRIVDVKDNNGALTYQTKGDANDLPDQDSPAEYIHNYEITSLCYDKDYHGMVLRGWGSILDFLQSQKGFFFVVLLPMIIFFMYELIRVVLNFANYKKTKADEEKEEAVKAAVAAAKAESDLHDLPESLADMSPEQLEQLKQFMEMQKAQNAAKDSTVEAAGTDGAGPSASDENDTQG